MALAELKGRPMGTQRVLIERGPVRVFAQALMDDDPVYSADGAPVPPTFPFRGAILGAVPKPVKKVGPLELDPVSPMTFGFQWGVKPVFDLKSIGPPVEFALGASGNARYTLKLIDKPGSLVPQLGLFGQGDFKGTIDWTSQNATSRPQIDLKGSFLLGVQGRF